MFYEPRLQNSGMQIDPLKSLVVPRPIGWISSVDLEGRPNVAPFSFFNLVAEDPPMVMFAAYGRKSNGESKDTRRNAETAGAFVVNLATWALKEKMNATSAQLASGVNEAELAGLELVPSRIVVAPRLSASPVALECRYLKTVDLPSPDPDEPNGIVIGEILGIHIDETLITEEGRVDITRARPIARLGYSLYAVVNEAFILKRPG